ncbi:hypothetical protein [Actinoplanes sp. N902-109]|uniref:hypothetical protein n=1 Tax=Actinoplanes sp. (strain N902-109) TaxID=649831 RepID=UPI0012FA745F|nr:hypothetical protein [Actinoplanes sp. N902-109]
MTDDYPVAFRSWSRVEKSRWLHRPRRVPHYDARWADGRVQTDIHLVDLMYRRAPADYVVVKKVLDDRCPDEGTSPWIGYPYGDVIE